MYGNQSDPARVEEAGMAFLVASWKGG